MTDKKIKCIKLYKQKLETKESEFRDNTLQKSFLQNQLLFLSIYLLPIKIC